MRRQKLHLGLVLVLESPACARQEIQNRGREKRAGRRPQNYMSVPSWKKKLWALSRRKNLGILLQADALYPDLHPKVGCISECSENSPLIATDGRKIQHGHLKKVADHGFQL